MLFLASTGSCMLLAECSSCLFVCLRRFCLLLAGFRPAGEVLFLRGQEKYPKEGRPCCLRPFALRRATCVVAFAGCAAKLSTR